MSLHKYSIVLLALLALLCSCHDEDKGDIPQSDERTADFIEIYKELKPYVCLIFRFHI
ncbi:hypothetical protein BACFRA24663_09570 [Bacteroides fragilis]